MSAKRSRMARAEAYKLSSDLWKGGEKQVFSGPKGFFRKLFRKKKWLDIIARWYKSNLNRRAKTIAEYIRSGDAEKDFRERGAFAHIQRKAYFKRMREHQKEQANVKD
jgi:hypothetical protein